jgi:Ring finger domain
MNRNSRFNIRTLEENLQTMLENVLQNYLNPGQPANPVQPTNPVQPPNPVPAPNINNRNQTYVDQMAILHTIRELTQGYTSNIREYNQNMREYNSNITTALSLIRLFYQRQANENIDRINTEPRTSTQGPVQAPAQVPAQGPVQLNARNPILTFTMFPYTNTGRAPLYENVVVAPTNEQVEEATEQLSYSPDMILINTQCPIALEDFVEGESLVRIRHCGHTFRQASIHNWFRSNVRCPVCRHDIREESAQENTNIQGEPPETNTIVNEYLRNFTLDPDNNDLDQDSEHDELEFIAEITTTYNFPIQEDSSYNTIT